MRKYELVIIFVPTLEEDGISEELSKITSIIEKSNGKVLNTDTWGIKKLAYPVKHQENGYYVVLYFDSDGKVIPEIERINKINEKILRQMIVKSNE